MSEMKSRFEATREWMVENKLRTVDITGFVAGCLWLSCITGSIAYNWSRPSMKTSVKIIHARLHAQALTLAALAGAAAVEYYDRRTRTRDKTDRFAEFLPVQTSSHKD